MYTIHYYTVIMYVMIYQVHMILNSINISLIHILWMVATHWGRVAPFKNENRHGWLDGIAGQRSTNGFCVNPEPRHSAEPARKRGWTWTCLSACQARAIEYYSNEASTWVCHGLSENSGYPWAYGYPEIRWSIGGNRHFFPITIQ